MVVVVLFVQKKAGVHGSRTHLGCFCSTPQTVQDRGAPRDSSTPETCRSTARCYQIRLSFSLHALGINPPMASQWRDAENMMSKPINIIGMSM